MQVKHWSRGFGLVLDHHTWQGFRTKSLREYDDMHGNGWQITLHPTIGQDPTSCPHSSATFWSTIYVRTSIRSLWIQGRSQFWRMLETTRIYPMEQLRTKRDLMKKRNDKICPKFEKSLKKPKKKLLQILHYGSRKISLNWHTHMGESMWLMLRTKHAHVEDKTWLASLATMLFAIFPWLEGLSRAWFINTTQGITTWKHTNQQ